MTVDAARAFRAGFDELEQADVPFDIRRKVGDWYATDYLPEMSRTLGKDLNINDYLPAGPAAYYLQYHYVVTNPYPKDRRKLVDDPGDGSVYSRQHALYHPLLRGAANAFGFFDLLLADPKSGRLVYTVDKEVDFATSLRTGPYRNSNVSVAVAHCAASADRSAVCFEDFAPYAPSRGAPTAFMAAPVIDQGLVIAVLVAQLSVEEIDNVVTGDRQWRQDGFGATGEAYVVGSDRFVRSGPRAFYENPDQYFAELKGGGELDENIDAIRRFGTPVTHQRVVTEAARAALAGVEGTGEILGYRRIPTLASWGPLAIPGTKWALIAKIDTSEAFAPIYKLQRDLMIVGALALLVVIVTGAWLSRSLLGAVARAHRRRDALRGGRLRRQGGGAHAGRDRRLVHGVQRHGRGAARQEHRDREQEPRERRAAAERPAGADRQSPARRRAGHRRRLRRGDGGVRRPGGLHRHVVGDAAGRMSSPC